jgi:hypothetical protein
VCRWESPFDAPTGPSRRPIHEASEFPRRPYKRQPSVLESSSSPMGWKTHAWVPLSRCDNRDSVAFLGRGRGFHALVVGARLVPHRGLAIGVFPILYYIRRNVCCWFDNRRPSRIKSKLDIYVCYAALRRARSILRNKQALTENSGGARSCSLGGYCSCAYRSVVWWLAGCCPYSTEMPRR